MVGMPAPAIVGRSVGPAMIVPEEVELAPVVVAEEEESVDEASSVDVAVDSLERVLDSRVDVLVGSSLVLPLRSGRSSCAITIGAPARASSASSCVFLARRTMFAVVAALFERRLATMRLHRCYGLVEGCALGVSVVVYVLRPAFPCLPVSDGPSLRRAIVMLTLLSLVDCLVCAGRCCRLPRGRSRMQALARCRRQAGNAKQGTWMLCLAFARSCAA